jgi:hypothetical protein
VTVANNSASETTGTGSTVAHNHVPASAPDGVWVFIGHGTLSTDLITGVTYGGVAMTPRVRTEFDSTTEPGRVYSYFLGTGIPTGTQSVSVSKSNATTLIHVVCCSVVAGGNDTEIVDEGGANGDAGNAANPSVALTYSGRSCMSFVGHYNAANAPGSLAEFTGQTLVHDHDHGNFCTKVSRRTNVENTDQTLGHTTVSNSYAIVAIAIAEVVTATEYNQDVSGGITPTGALVKSTTKILGGGITPSGALVATLAKIVEGGITPTGAISKTTNKTLSGGVTFVGVITKASSRTLGGTLSFVGVVAKTTVRVLAGAVTFAGAIGRGQFKNLSGDIEPAGEVAAEFVDGEPPPPAGGVLTHITQPVRDTDIT